jgi:site-specific DNA-cytosine methylase
VNRRARPADSLFCSAVRKNRRKWFLPHNYDNRGPAFESQSSSSPFRQLRLDPRHCSRLIHPTAAKTHRDRPGMCACTRISRSLSILIRQQGSCASCPRCECAFSLLWVTMTVCLQQHRQIGNAVPVPLALALGKSLGEALLKTWANEERAGSPVV